jgi:hypothetical protein
MQPSYARTKPKTDLLEGLQITWKDGLPKDRAEESTIESTLIASELTSHYSSIKRLLDGDDDAAQEEIDRIRQEQADAVFNPALIAPAAPGGAPASGTQGPPADNIAASAQLVAQLRGGQGGGTNTPDEGGPKPK